MKFGLVLVLASAVFHDIARCASDAPVSPPKDPVALIADLGDESYRVRQIASSALWEMGKEVLPALQEAAAKDDPERALRARDLIRMIELNITPGSDPALVELVEKYYKASLAEKASLFGRMKSRRAWKQMLKLYAAETSAEVREKLKPALVGVAVRAAREQLMTGDAEGAREYLELAPVDADSLLALAVFHRSHGSLDEELEKARKAEGTRGAAWRLALHRASGDLVSALAEAKQANEPGLFALLAGFAGDPIPFLEKAREQGDVVASAYTELAIKRWNGGRVRASDTEPLTRFLNRNDHSERDSAINALFLLGMPELVEKSFSKNRPLEAFLHFDSLERIPDAISAIGLDPTKPDYAAWVRRRLERLNDEDIENQREASEEGQDLVHVANFLERRGLLDEAYGAFSEPLKRLSEKDENGFIDFIGQLFGSQASPAAPVLALRIGAEWAGEDAVRWEEMVATCLGSEDKDEDWWKWLGEIDPSLSPLKRFEVNMALLRVGPDPQGIRSRWMDRIWESVDKAPQPDQARMVALISEMAIEFEDAENSVKAWDRMAQEQRNEIFWGQRITHLSAMDRWKDVAEVVLSHIRAQGGDDGDVINELHAHAYAASALRLAGKEEEASAHDHWAETLYLGNPSFAIRIGNGYAFGRDYERAAVWWRRAALESGPESSEIMLVMKMFSDAMLESDQWKEAAAASEMMSRVYISSDYRWSSPVSYMKQRLQADLARALSQLGKDRAKSIQILEASHQVFVSDGALADFFFPALRRVGLIAEHDRWFEKTWAHMAEVIAAYPNSDNTLNTAGWFASRAIRRLDEAEKLLTSALSIRPDQPAYLDTMAEIEFARGRRDEALKWSSRAINMKPDDTMIRRQHERFRSDPLPE